ncbi:MAG: beta-ketoacyl-ACP synthase III [Nostocoides sp.]
MSTPAVPRKTIHAPKGAQYARILGVGGYRPERVIPNSELVEAIDSSDEWIRERSGIVTRHFAAHDESVVDMSVHAARDAIAAAGVSVEDIDVILIATVTHPYQTPAAAPALAERLGIPTVAAFDISAACAGYAYGISLANDMIRGGSAGHVLVIGVEKLSDFTDFHDRGTAFIFGDGAGAAVVGPSDVPGIGPTIWGSDATRWDAIAQRVPWTELRDTWRAEAAGDQMPWPALTMQGQAVFRWAVWGMPPVLEKALAAAGITAGDLDAFIPHQANMRIVDAMVKQLKLPEHVPVARDIATTGNTSAASVPLATERMLREGEIPHGGLALQIGFGAGLAYAAQVIVLP